MIPMGEVASQVQVRIGERATDRAEHHVVRGDSEVDVLDEGDLEAVRVGVRVGVGVGVRVRVRVRVIGLRLGLGLGSGSGLGLGLRWV